MANIPPKKPVNDLIKFWAEKQEKKKISEPVLRPLSPNTSSPPSRSDSSYDKSSNSPPLSPTKQSQNIHTSIPEGGNNNSADNSLSIIDIKSLPKKIEQGRIDWSSLPQNDSSKKEISSPISFLALKSIPPVPAKDSYITRPRDHNLGPPPARKVTDLVSKFEKVASPTDPVTTSPRSTSPLALSPIKRNQPTPEPLSLSTPTSPTNADRKQPIPKLLNISSKQITDEQTSMSPIQHTILNQNYESTPVSPISPIGHLSVERPISPLNFEQYIPEVQIQEKSTSPKNNNTSTQTNVQESNLNPVIIPSTKQELLRPTSPVQSDNLDFLSTTIQINQTNQKYPSARYSSEHGFLLPEISPISPFWKPTTESTPISPLWNPINDNTPVSPLWKPTSETTIQNNHVSQTKQLNNNKTFTSREISNVTSNSNNPFATSSHYEIPDLLPHPEPISPIRLSFSDFLKSPNESSTNLNSIQFNPPLNDKANSNISGTSAQGGENYNPFLDMETDQSDMYKVVVGPKSGDKKRQSLPSAKDTNAFIMEMHETNMQQSRSVPKKDEISSTNKPTFIKPISGTIQLVENLRRYLQPNKYKQSDDVNTLTINSNGEMTVSLRESGSSQTHNSRDGTKFWKLRNFKPVQIPKSPYSTTRPERNTLSSANTLKKNPFLIKKKTLKDTKHDLPEYNTSKSKMSVLVPHNLSSVEYGKINRSVPDLSVRYRHHKFNDVFRKNNMTVPNFVRVNSIFKDETKKPDFAMAIMTDAELDPSKITKFSINPFDESESNELFKPGAPWIHLPHLDEFIESLPPTEFSEPKDLMTIEEYEKFIGYGKSEDKAIESMFPPMNQVPEGICLDDLKHNIVKNDNLLSQGLKNNILDAAIDIALSLQTTTTGIQLMSVEIVRDFIQILTLVLSFVSTSIFGNGVKITLDTIPNLLSLNWEHVFGNGSAFFLSFCVIVFGGLYWFRLMTKYDPNADVEGFESHPWNLRPESKRKQNIAVVFILTTLYLPLSKLSLDALVWSDTFWPVPNPYHNNVDFPDFGKGSGSNTVRDPQDFCYVTSMNKGDLNFTPVIIAIALVTIGVFTFWFPIALKRLVDKNLPRVDKYNEIGETRNNPDEEYKRLLEKDICPYNFLYNGYNEKWAAHKTFVMANKFLLIFLVSVISKDNCLFRSFSRMRVDTISYSLQIILMIILFLLHWKYEPFLYRNQNLSEYWSRAHYVIASVLGLFIVLKVGPAKQIGIALTTLTILTCIAIGWYVIMQTNRYRSFVKVLKKQLDFSLNIYSPKLNFAKHIKRRIWQETWTTLLLTSEQFKMCDGKTVAFSQSSFRPPYLLNFSGTVSERHVENLKIIRQIGIKNYTSAMSPLSASLAKLRSTIVNNFVGPDMYYAPEFFVLQIKTCFGKAYVVPFPFSVVVVYDEDESVLVLTQEWEIQRYVQQNENKEIQRRRLVRQMLRALEGNIILGPCDKSDIDKINDKKGSIHYHHGLLSIQRSKRSKWHNHNMNPGFKVTVSYASANKWHNINGTPQPPHERIVGHDVLGITDDFQMTYQLQKLFSDNQEIVQKGLVKVQNIMNEYRQYYRDEARWKEETLTYGFFVNIYDNPSIPLESLPALLITTEENKLIQEIPESEYPSLIYLYERMRVVNLSRVHQWWYLFWEDLWRKNHKEMPDLAKHPQDFSPAYRTSLCYRPMTRMELEEFLEKRGCWKNGGKRGFLHSGVLNRIYLYLNNVIFGGKQREDRTPKKWNIAKGNTIEKGTENNVILGHVRRTMRERVMVMKNIMLRKQNSFPRTRPFFVLHEDSDPENDEQCDNSDGINSASDEETWW